MLQVVLFVLILIAIYAMIAIPLNLMMGYGGLLSLTPAAFFGVGAYSVAILTTRAQADFLPAMATAVVLSGVMAAAISIPFLRLRDDYFVIGTLAFAMVASSVMLNWTDVTRGAIGISGIRSPELFGVTFRSYESFVVLALAFALAALVFTWRIARSPTAVLLRGIRDDETAAAALGRDVSRLKVYVTVYSAVWLGAAGGLFAYLISAVDPSPYQITASILFQSLIIVGGSGNLYGPLLGCLVLVPLPEILRFLHVPLSSGAELRNILYGLLLIFFMRFRPQGFIGERTLFVRRSSESDAATAIESVTPEVAS